MPRKDNAEAGKLKIGDNWNVISIIALSQNNPLKALAEFIENSIDAGAKNVTLVRGKQKNEFYLKVIDDGCGIDDFKYVATHIGDSIKRELKNKGSTDIQGEFGIGLLSFWTVGEVCTITSAGEQGIARSMKLVKGNPSYAIREVGNLFNHQGTELTIAPILPGIRTLSAEKIQNFLASELRDRISKSGVRIKIVDHTSRRELIVEPRQFKGRLIHHIPEAVCPFGEIYLELYMAESQQTAEIGLYKNGTRILSDLAGIDRFSGMPWNSRAIEGIIDVPFLQLTPGTRDGVVLDDVFESFCIAMEPIEAMLNSLLEEQKRAEEEEASKQVLSRVTRAFREAFLHLPSEDYGWLVAKTRESRKSSSGAVGGEPGTSLAPGEAGPLGADGVIGKDELLDNETSQKGESADMPGSSERETIYGEYIPNPLPSEPEQKSFFDFAGPLYKLMISPASSIIGVGYTKKLKAVPRDKSGRAVERDISYEWNILDGGGILSGIDTAYVEYTAPDEPGLITLELRVRQGDLLLSASAIITVTAELEKRIGGGSGAMRRGLPGYTYRKAPGELWRSKYDVDQSIIIINNAHADFIFASRHPMTKLRYVVKLFAKELVFANFPEASKEEILERMVELLMYTDEGLR
jgi:hypothetical protein